MIVYAQHIIWDGNDVSATGEVFTEVQEAAVKLAKECGWAPRKWWQFWRWPEPSCDHLSKYF